jgi:hypothetical protein
MKVRICISPLKNLFMCTLCLELHGKSKKSIGKVVFVFPNLKKLFMCVLYSGYMYTYVHAVREHV